MSFYEINHFQPPFLMVLLISKKLIHAFLLRIQYDHWRVNCGKRASFHRLTKIIIIFIFCQGWRSLDYSFRLPCLPAGRRLNSYLAPDLFDSPYFTKTKPVFGLCCSFLHDAVVAVGCRQNAAASLVQGRRQTFPECLAIARLFVSASASTHISLPTCSIPHISQKQNRSLDRFCFCGHGGNRTHMDFRPHDFESCASASSATRPFLKKTSAF
jgi:hypothetical protein